MRGIAEAISLLSLDCFARISASGATGAESSAIGSLAMTLFLVKKLIYYIEKGSVTIHEKKERYYTEKLRVKSGQNSDGAIGDEVAPSPIAPSLKNLIQRTPIKDFLKDSGRCGLS